MMNALELGSSCGRSWTLLYWSHVHLFNTDQTSCWVLQELAYKPQTPLDEGIQRFCEWFKRYYGLRGEDSSGKFASDWAYNPLR